MEADEQQINLTRFSLFFPEKREFFLENQGVFAFGGEAGAGQFAGISNTPILFYSRRIGLHSEDGVTREAPIDAGGRLTGRIGKYSVGLLNVRTGNAPAAGAQATSFSVFRLRRDLFRRSNIGVMVTDRSVSQHGAGRNQVFGADGLFSFYQNLNISTYWAETRTGSGRGGRTSVRTGRATGCSSTTPATATAYSLSASPSATTSIRRSAFCGATTSSRASRSSRFSPRPRSIAAIRQFFWEGQIDYIADRDGLLETRQARGRFAVEFENSNLFDVIYNRN